MAPAATFAPAQAVDSYETLNEPNVNTCFKEHNNVQDEVQKSGGVSFFSSDAVTWAFRD